VKEPTAQEEWIQVLRGEIDPLEHGYYCVKLLDEVERNSDAESQGNALRYLEDEHPWNQLDPSRLGVGSVARGVGGALVDMIVKL
jgi:hypothetical protein